MCEALCCEPNGSQNSNNTLQLFGQLTRSRTQFTACVLLLVCSALAGFCKPAGQVLCSAPMSRVTGRQAPHSVLCAGPCPLVLHSWAGHIAPAIGAHWVSVPVSPLFPSARVFGTQEATHYGGGSGGVGRVPVVCTPACRRVRGHSQGTWQAILPGGRNLSS